ncbi:DUF1674 domain-containing protein [Tropicimonas sp. TH_r6]|uniref:DUF1674 domain-containing protein n=1 Tax=Tropicimonas sp. TH_r6 TaxID=3082085 RepID=UPI0029555048|nr:DUF1674 domain-containing protein [Tropicimonas sp. TH_r6]MDV7141215.1 DUF1674 domain-containing protein [Tropicimonas sp. TH_r6]
MDDQTQQEPDQPELDPEAAAKAEAERRKSLPPAALRALEEAEERRARAEAEAEAMPTELGGRIKGLEPIRYGDWEKKGLAIDF